MKRLSILIPTFNRKNLLEETLQSVLRQGELLKDTEVLISNDASTDGTKKFLEDFKNENAQIDLKVFNHDKNLGGPGNWSFLLKEASGEYVFLLSDDDTVKKNFLQKYFQIMNTYPNIDIIYSAIDYCDEHMNLRSKHLLSSERGLVSGIRRAKNQLVANHMVMSSVYRRETLLLAGGWQEKYGTCLDGAAFAKTCLKSKDTYFLDESFLCFRLGSQTWSSFKIEKQKKHYIWFRTIIDDVIQILKEENPDYIDDFKKCYSAHAQGVLNMFDLKIIHQSINKTDLRKLLSDLRSVFPEVFFMKSYYKLLLVSFFGLSWLQTLRKLLKKPDIYGTSVFEQDFKKPF